MNAYYLLAIDIIIVGLQLFSSFGNGLIIACFFTCEKLRKNTSLWLILTVSIADLIFALSTIPHVCNYLIGWTATGDFNYNGQLVIILSLPQTIHFKVNLCLATALAIDRLQAMSCPLYYRNKSHRLYIICTLAFGLLCSAVDVYFELTMEHKTVSIGCAAVGCFTSKNFRIYWGASNSILNLFMFATSIMVIIKFNRFRRNFLLNKNQTTSVQSQQNQQQHQLQIYGDNKCNANENRRCYQANLIAIAMLCITFFTQFVPSTLMFLVDLFASHSLFRLIGPFYIIGLLAAGALNSLVYVLLHVDFWNATKQILGCKIHLTHDSAFTLSPSTVARQHEHRRLKVKNSDKDDTV